jgi:adenylate cyclase
METGETDSSPDIHELGEGMDTRRSKLLSSQCCVYSMSSDHLSALESGQEPCPQPTGKGEDTFFQSRGRLLMEGPLAELAGLAEQIIAQADMLGHPQLVPEFQRLRDRAHELREGFLRAPIPLGESPSGPVFPSSKPQTRFLLKWLNTQKDQNEDVLKTGVAPTASQGRILVVEDEPDAQALLKLLLETYGYTLVMASDGQTAWEILQRGQIDLVLLDLFLPEMNGYELLERMRSNSALNTLPTIVVSGAVDMDGVVRCVELGADDFLPKPFHPLLLRTRIDAGLERKRLRDQENAYLQQIKEEREKSDRLLLNVLPSAIADRLKGGEGTIAESFADVTVLFADIAHFTELSERTPAPQLVGLLNEIFSAFDQLAEIHGLEKIKTIGDNYMAVGGLPVPCLDHAIRVAAMALDMQTAISKFNTARGTGLALRIGIHSGPVVAGIIGQKKFSYDLWGDTVNLASRMESHGHPGEIQVSEASQLKLRSHFRVELRGKIPIKGKSPMNTFLLKGKLVVAP